MHSETDVILNTFQLLARSGKEITLTNVYKAVPISYEATVLAVDGEKVKVRTHKYQIVCLQRDRVTYVQSNLFPNVVKAMVTEVDLVNDEATLANFEFANNGIGGRRFDRVAPGEPVEVLIEDQGHEVKLSTDLLDVSQGGMGVVLASEPAYAHLFTQGTGVIVNLTLPPVEDAPPRSLRVEGTVVYTKGQGDNMKHRVGLRLFPDGEAAEALSEFISRRKSEIMGEIDDLLDSLSE